MLLTICFLLAATVLFVSMTRRLGFGSILGYLLAGVLIGPSALGLVADVEHIREISELGVLMLLFLIGLELRLARIWTMRRAVFGLGGAQMLVTGAALSLLLHLAGVGWVSAAVLGAGLALSSTAIVLPMLGERDLLPSAAGRDAFSVLLFQDMASIPLIALVPFIAGTGGMSSDSGMGVLQAAGVVALILLGGRYLVRPAFRLIGGVRTPEVFTAMALLTVVGSAALAELVGLPMSLGAFAAGVVLSESEYRHELQADVEPFEGLLLGFFFISVGMSANIALAVAEPVLIGVGVVGLLAVKAAVAFGLGKLRGQSNATAVRFALAIPQGSEFAFVLFGGALAAGALAQAEVDRAILVIALSMLASPVIFTLSERWLQPMLSISKRRPQDTAEDAAPAPVVICGFGRFGQVVGRILALRRIPFNALDHDAENIELVRKFGYKAYFGDPTRLDLLRAVGADQAKIIVVALPDVAENLKLAELARRHFPQARIFARARNRRHAHLLMDIGVQDQVRETLFSSLRLTELVLNGLGLEPEDARRTVQMFRERDEQMLIDQQGIYKDEKQMIQTSAAAAEELRRLFEADTDR